MIKYTELKTCQRHNLRDIIPLQKPFTVLIEPSNYCNFRCVSCFQSLCAENYITQHRSMMSLNLCRKILEQIKAWEGPRLKVLKLSLYGEPFTNPEFCEILRLSREADVAERIETTTNASLITPEIAARLVENEIDYIRVSIYGGNQARYRAVTGVESANIDEIFQNLQQIQLYKKQKNKERPFVSVKMLDTFGPENEEFIQRFTPVADEIYIDVPHNWVATKEKSFIDSLYQTPEQQKRLSINQKALYRERKSCPMAFTTLAIRADGAVSPCCVDWVGHTNLGSVESQTLPEIWNGAAMYQFRRMQLEGRNKENESCRHCELFKSAYYTLDDIDGVSVERLGECDVPRAL